LAQPLAYGSSSAYRCQQNVGQKRNFTNAFIFQNKPFILLRFLGLWTVYDRRDEVYAKRLPADQRASELQNSQLFKHSHWIQRDAVKRLRQSEGRLFFQGKWRHDVSNSVWTSSCI